MRRWLAVLFSILIMPLCYAGMLSITPTRLVLSAEQPVGVLTLTNPNDMPTLIHLKIMRWTQERGKDHYQPTEDILATPPVFELPPHKSQVIRFAIQNQINPRSEQAYRVYLREVVTQTKIFRHLNSQLKVALSISVPVFIHPEVVERKFVWSAKWSDNQHLQIQLHNTGNITLFTNQWQLFSANKPLSHKKTVFSYIQPGQSEAWTIKASQFKPPLNVSANINGELMRTHAQMP
jgi:fimbrial chaperone protein